MLLLDEKYRIQCVFSVNPPSDVMQRKNFPDLITTQISVYLHPYCFSFFRSKPFSQTVNLSCGTLNGRRIIYVDVPYMVMYNFFQV